MSPLVSLPILYSINDTPNGVIGQTDGPFPPRVVNDLLIMTAAQRATSRIKHLSNKTFNLAKRIYSDALDALAL